MRFCGSGGILNRGFLNVMDKDTVENRKITAFTSYIAENQQPTRYAPGMLLKYIRFENVRS